MSNAVCTPSAVRATAKRAARKRFGLRFQIMLGLVSCAVSLLLLEAGIRVCLPVYNPAGHIDYVRNTDGVPLAIPGFVGRHWKNTGDYDVPIRINVLGFRDEKDLSDAGPDDLYVVGDSYSFGHGVREEERYSNCLEQLLGTRVYNIAIPADLEGYVKLVRYAEDHGADIRTLIVGVCMENDLRDYRRPEIAADADSWLRRVANDAKYLLTKHSATYNAFTSLLHHNHSLKSWAVSTGLIKDNIAGMNSNTFDEQVLDISINRLKQATEAYDATIVVIPSRGLWIGDNRQNEARVHQAFVGRLQQEFPRVIDLKPVWEADGDPLQYHFPNDGHWNSRGHAKAAETIAAHLR